MHDILLTNYNLLLNIIYLIANLSFTQIARTLG